MQITADLNLAFPIQFDDKGEALIWAYHTPISTVVFQANYRIIAATQHELFKKGVAYAATLGPRLATLTLMDMARADAEERGVSEEMGTAFRADLKRLTTLLAPSPEGFNSVPVDVAISRGIITAEDWEEGESALVFFTSAFMTAPRVRRARVAEASALVLGGSITSLAPTEFAASLPTSTPTETSVEPAVSSVPS